MHLKSVTKEFLTEKCTSFQIYFFRYIFGILSVVFSLNCLDQFTFIVNYDNTQSSYIKFSLLIWLIFFDGCIDTDAKPMAEILGT